MALPQRCKKCRCYIAPQLTRCPRCNAPTPATKVASTSEERAAARAAEDGKVTTILAKKMRWVPSEFSVAVHKRTLPELERRLHSADTIRLRNTVRSEIRACKAVITRGENRKGAWTYEFFRTKHVSVPVTISPKGNRYVSAASDIKADLIIIHRKGAAFKTTRLQRFEKSKYARYVKDEVKEQKVQKKRKVAKAKQNRLKKSLRIREGRYQPTLS